MIDFGGFLSLLATCAFVVGYCWLSLLVVGVSWFDEASGKVLGCVE
jgi:hypothetical protein